MIIMICSRNSFSGSVTVQQQEQAERHLSCCYSILGEYKVSTFEVSSRVSHAHTHTHPGGLAASMQYLLLPLSRAGGGGGRWKQQ